MSPQAICIHCHRGPDAPPWCVGNPGKGCTYGYGHEFPEAPKVQAATAKRVDTKLCRQCGLHPKNPAAFAGCVPLDGSSSTMYHDFGASS